MLAFLYLHASGQCFSLPQALTYDQGPDLKERDRKIENCISFTLSKSYLKILHDTSGKKIRLPVKWLVINGDTLAPATISTRGKSTLHFSRKSFCVSIGRKAGFIHGEKTDSLKKFCLLSLSMDKYYHNNRLAYEMMKNCRLFDLYYTFCDVRINGKSEGIYMIVERPEEWAMKKKKSPVVIRRGYNEEIEKIGSKHGISKEEIARIRNSYQEIYRVLNRFQGEDLYRSVSNLLDLDAYMKWIAFNFLVRNGDYTDEVYFYYDPVSCRFKIIPWDYDDLFMLSPHEGKETNKAALAGKLIFSAEDLLDKKIVEDKYLYRVYLLNFRKVLLALSDDKLKGIFENTFAELYPYYLDNEIIGMSKYDIYPDATVEKLRQDLLSFYDIIKRQRDFYFNYLTNAK